MKGIERVHPLRKVLVVKIDLMCKYTEMQTMKWIKDGNRVREWMKDVEQREKKHTKQRYKNTINKLKRGRRSFSRKSKEKYTI